MKTVKTSKYSFIVKMFKHICMLFYQTFVIFYYNYNNPTIMFWHYFIIVNSIDSICNENIYKCIEWGTFLGPTLSNIAMFSLPNVPLISNVLHSFWRMYWVTNGNSEYESKKPASGNFTPYSTPEHCPNISYQGLFSKVFWNIQQNNCYLKV